MAVGRRALSGMATPLRFAVNFSYYGLSLDMSGLGLNVYQTQLLFGAVELPSKLLTYLSVRQAGRRLTLVGTLLVAALTFGIRLLMSSGEPRPRPCLLAENYPAFPPESPTQGQLSLTLSVGSTFYSGNLTT